MNDQPVIDANTDLRPYPLAFQSVTGVRTGLARGHGPPGCRNPAGHQAKSHGVPTLVNVLR